jgi:hypothetical protein
LLANLRMVYSKSHLIIETSFTQNPPSKNCSINKDDKKIVKILGEHMYRLELQSQVIISHTFLWENPFKTFYNKITDMVLIFNKGYWVV